MAASAPRRQAEVRTEAKLSEYQRKEANKCRAAGETLADIAKSYAVDVSMTSRLARVPFNSDHASAAA